MRNEKKDSRVIQDVTGTRYTTALKMVRYLRLLGRPRYEAYFNRIDMLPDLKVGQERCVRCLYDFHFSEDCLLAQ